MSKEGMGDPSRLVAAIDGVRPIDGEATLRGHAHILGAIHHAWFIRVAERRGEQVAFDDPQGRLDDLHYLARDGGTFSTVEVPGFSGSYVVVIAPAVTR